MSVLKRNQPLLVGKSKDNTNYSYQSDLLYAQLSVNSEIIGYINEFLVQLDPAIDYFILPTFFLDRLEKAFTNQSIMPDLSGMWYDQPGQWSKLEHAPSLTVNFVVDDIDKQSQFIDVEISTEQFMVKTNQDTYTPNIVFQDIYAENDQTIIVLGKQIFQKMMYDKYATSEKTIRCLSPLKNAHISVN